MIKKSKKIIAIDITNIWKTDYFLLQIVIVKDSSDSNSNGLRKCLLFIDYSSHYCHYVLQFIKTVAKRNQFEVISL